MDECIQDHRSIAFLLEQSRPSAARGFSAFTVEEAPAPTRPQTAEEVQVPAEGAPLEVGEFGWVALRLHLPDWEVTDTEDVECVVLQKGSQGTLIGVPLRGDTAVSDEAPRFSSLHSSGQSFDCTAVRVPGAAVSRLPIPPGRREVQFRFPEASAGPAVVRGFYSSEGLPSDASEFPLAGTDDERRAAAPVR